MPKDALQSIVKQYGSDGAQELPGGWVVGAGLTPAAFWRRLAAA